MKSRSVVKTMKTACGKTVTYLQADGESNKMHSIEGPAIVYPENENKAPEYYLYGMKYSKSDWETRVAQRESSLNADAMFEIDY